MQRANEQYCSGVVLPQVSSPQSHNDAFGPVEKTHTHTQFPAALQDSLVSPLVLHVSVNGELVGVAHVIIFAVDVGKY